MSLTKSGLLKILNVDPLSKQDTFFLLELVNVFLLITDMAEL